MIVSLLIYLRFRYLLTHVHLFLLHLVRLRIELDKYVLCWAFNYQDICMLGRYKNKRNFLCAAAGWKHSLGLLIMLTDGADLYGRGLKFAVALLFYHTLLNF